MLGCLLLIAAGVVAATAHAEPRQQYSAWGSVFDMVRPMARREPRRAIVVFDAPSLADVLRKRGSTATVAEQRRIVAKLTKAQDARIALLATQGIDVEVVHRYVRVVNGVSLTLHSESFDALRATPGVRSVTRARTVYPSAVPAKASRHAQAPVAATKARDARATVAVLDTAVDFNHPAIRSAAAGPGYDLLAHHVGVVAGPADAHGTEVASAVVTAGGDDVKVNSVRVLGAVPVIGGYEAVLGTMDDLIAGLEYAVDPNGDGAVTDAADVALIASGAPYAGFADAPEAEATNGASQLGMFVVAAAGNDGPSGDETGTIASPAAADATLAVGAADLRGSTPRSDVHLKAGLLDTVFSDLPVLTPARSLPSGMVPVVVIDGGATKVVDYLDAQANSRVDGAIALLDRHAGALFTQQVRAAADAGAVAVLIAGAESASGGVVDAGGVDIPAIGVSTPDARTIREAIASDGDAQVELVVDANAHNRDFGSVAPFSSRGPRYDGSGKPDVVAAGIGVLAATAGGDGSGGGRYRLVSGTSIASGIVAGQAAALRARHPGWSPVELRAVLIATAVPLGAPGNRSPIEAQGAGVVDVDSAVTATAIATPARIDFGIVTPGGDPVHRPLALRTLTGKPVALPGLRDERTRDTGPVPTVSTAGLDISVPAGTPNGIYGGWLLAADHLRIPWTVVVERNVGVTVTVKAALSTARLVPLSGRDGFASRLTLDVDGTGTGDMLGLRAAGEMEIAVVNPQGHPVATIGSMTDVLPGRYTFGVTGVGAGGATLKPGAYAIRVRVRPPGVDTEWSVASRTPFTIATR
jgi:hypothetical protein